MTRPAEAPRAQRRVVVGWLVVLVVGSAWMLATTDAGAQTDAPEPSVELGAELYAIHCAECHGASGQGGFVPGTQARVPPLAGEGVTVPYIDLVLRTGRMPPGGDPFDNQSRTDFFNDVERLSLVAFTEEVFGLEGEIPEVGEGDPARGQQIYGTNCAACHGATGTGGVAGGGAWTPAVYQYEPPAIAEAIRIGPFQMPAFEEEQISDQEVADVAAFLQEIQEEEGTVLGLVELNPVFISAFVAAMSLILVLSLLWISGRPTWFPDPEAASDAHEDEAVTTAQDTT